MRLTLRTLLGWIDGVLPPEEQRLIGEMVAGSTVATRLAEKIRKGASCGSTDLPLTDGPAIADDPNRVAEYLDNTLALEHLTTFERFCIESKPHLAEVATCHGILADMYRAPRLARMPREQRSVLGERIRRSLSTVAVPPHVPSAARSEGVSRGAVTVEEPAAAADGHADARAAADTLVRAMLGRPSRPLEPVRTSDGGQDPAAARVGLLPAWPRSDAAPASEPAANGFVAIALHSEPAMMQPAAASPEPAVSPTAASSAGRAARLPGWTAWVTAVLALVVLLAAGGALTSPLRGSKTYKPEPGCMHCTKP